MTRNYLVLDDDGQPVGVLDAHRIGQDSNMLAVALAVALAAATSDPDQCAELVVEMQVLMDPVAHQYVVTAALLTVIDILERTLQVADCAGVHLRPIVRAISAQFVPTEPTGTTDPEGPK
ncbi:MAG: hypothetical protein ACR2P2_10895 [Nakamurella sp.]